MTPLTAVYVFRGLFLHHASSIYCGYLENYRSNWQIFQKYTFFSPAWTHRMCFQIAYFAVTLTIDWAQVRLLPVLRLEVQFEMWRIWKYPSTMIGGKIIDCQSAVRQHFEQRNDESPEWTQLHFKILTTDGTYNGAHSPNVANKLLKDILYKDACNSLLRKIIPAISQWVTCVGKVQFIL